MSGPVRLEIDTHGNYIVAGYYQDAPLFGPYNQYQFKLPAIPVVSGGGTVGGFIAKFKPDTEVL